jgi:hypothetical protein
LNDTLDFHLTSNDRIKLGLFRQLSQISRQLIHQRSLLIAGAGLTWLTPFPLPPLPAWDTPIWVR